MTAENVRRLPPPTIEVEQVLDPTTQPAAQEAAEQQAAQAQALSEGVTLADHVEVLGGRYRIGSKIGLMPLMKFAHAAKQGVDSADMDGLDAMYQMMRDCIHPDDWDRFEADMIAEKADEQDFMGVVQRTIEILSARPTRQPSASSSGPSPISVSSKAASSSPQAGRVPAGAEGLVPVADLGRASAG